MSVCVQTSRQLIDNKIVVVARDLPAPSLQVLRDVLSVYTHITKADAVKVEAGGGSGTPLASAGRSVDAMASIWTERLTMQTQPLARFFAREVGVHAAC